MNIKPLPGYCLILPIEEEQQTSTGVYVPETSKDKPSKGRVIKRGAPIMKGSRIVLGSPVSEGDIVIYKKWTNQEVQHEGKTYLLVHFNELLAVIE